MALFGNDEDYTETQKNIYQTQLEQQQEKLNELEGVDTPASALEREQIENNMKDLLVNIAQMEQAQQQEQEQADAQNMGGLDD